MKIDITETKEVPTKLIGTLRSTNEVLTNDMSFVSALKIFGAMV